MSGKGPRRANGNASRKPRRDAGDAFFPDPEAGPARAPDDLAEELAEEFLESATTGQEQGEEAHEMFVEEEIGGPFVVTTPSREFGHAFDASNIPGTEPEAFPTTSAVELPADEDDSTTTA